MPLNSSRFLATASMRFARSSSLTERGRYSVSRSSPIFCGRSVIDWISSEQDGGLLAASGREGRADAGNVEGVAVQKVLQVGGAPIELGAGFGGVYEAQLRQQRGLGL